MITETMLMAKIRGKKNKLSCCLKRVNDAVHQLMSAIIRSLCYIMRLFAFAIQPSTFTLGNSFVISLPKIFSR